MMKAVFFSFLSGIVVGPIVYAIVVVRDLKDQSNHVVVNAADSTPFDARFFKHLQNLRQNKDKLGDFLLIRDRLSAFVQDEMTREPRAFAALIEEAIPLTPNIGPIAALKLEPYATEAVRKGAQSLLEEAQVADFLKLKEKISELEKKASDAEDSKTKAEDAQKQAEKDKEEALTAKDIAVKEEEVVAMSHEIVMFGGIVIVLSALFFVWLEKKASDADAKKKIRDAQKQAEMANIVPVLLINVWIDAVAVFRITNLKTQEQRNYTLTSAVGGRQVVEEIIYLLPGEYEVETRGLNPNDVTRKNFVLVHPEPMVDHQDKKYHAVVQTSGFNTKDKTR